MCACSRRILSSISVSRVRINSPRSFVRARLNPAERRATKAILTRLGACYKLGAYVVRGENGSGGDLAHVGAGEAAGGGCCGVGLRRAERVVDSAEDDVVA